MTQILACLDFLAALVLIATAGGRLSRYGELLGERTGLGGSWIGLALLAPVTSLPELITGLGAVGLTHSVDIAVGAILGSCVFNLLIIALLDFLFGRELVFARLKRSHLLSAGFSLLLLAVTGLALVVEREDPRFGLFQLGYSSPLIFVGYFVAMRAIFRRQQIENRGRDAEPEREAPGLSDRALVLRFAAASVVVIGAGLWLPFAGMRLASAFGLHETFIGTLFVAFATSVPEVVVAVAALRIGSPNMAFSNLIGSNLFNVAILVPEDLLYRPGPLLSAASRFHAVSALSAMIMTALVMVALLARPRGGVFRLSLVSVMLIATYLINSYLIFVSG